VAIAGAATQNIVNISNRVEKADFADFNRFVCGENACFIEKRFIVVLK
jgi:hypothetical protein